MESSRFVSLALDGVLAGWEQNDTMLQIHSWKLFVLSPRCFYVDFQGADCCLGKRWRSVCDVHAGKVGEGRVCSPGWMQEEFQGTQKKGPMHH